MLQVMIALALYLLIGVLLNYGVIRLMGKDGCRYTVLQQMISYAVMAIAWPVLVMIAGIDHLLHRRAPDV